MIFHDISQGVFSVGRITPNGVSLLGTAFAINKQRRCCNGEHRRAVCSGTRVLD